MTSTRSGVKMKAEDVRAACVVLFGDGLSLSRYADQLSELLDCHSRTVQEWLAHGVQGISAQAVRLALQARFLEDENAKLKARKGKAAKGKRAGASGRAGQLRLQV